MRRINILIFVFFTCFISAAWPQARPQYQNNIITFDVPGAGTGPGQGTFGVGPNDLGAIAGFYVDSSYGLHGFLRNPFGKITEFDAPNAVCGTIAINPNDAGEIDGVYYDSNCIPHGFVSDRFGNFTEFDAPDAVGGTSPEWMNFTGQVTGYWIDSNGMSHGFVRAADGTITEFDPPGNGGEGATPTFINSGGAITGW